MIYSETVLRRAKARLAQERDEAQRRVDEIYAAIPRLSEIDGELRRTMAEVALAALSKNRVAETVAAAKERSLALQQERNWLLQVNELEERDLDPASVCTECGGTGYVGARMCSCLKELCRQEQKKELSFLLGGRESFDTFRLDYYPAEEDASLGMSPRRWMGKVFARCREYADGFSAAASPSLLFSGATGLGKTFLSACIARQVADAGSSVVYNTVGAILADFEKARFGDKDGSDELTRKYLACDLLILDDLGTELVTPFSQSALYELVNTRLVRRLPTIISTNLSARELSATYLPQTVSRLLGTYELIRFFGSDIRMAKA